MSSSYRSDLNSGWMPEEEAKLREAVRLIDEVRDRFGRLLREDGGVPEDSSSDGAFRERMLISSRLIEGELPGGEGDSGA